MKTSLPHAPLFPLRPPRGESLFGKVAVVWQLSKRPSFSHPFFPSLTAGGRGEEPVPWHTPLFSPLPHGEKRRAPLFFFHLSTRLISGEEFSPYCTCAFAGEKRRRRRRPFCSAHKPKKRVSEQKRIGGVRQNTIGGGGVKKRHVEMSFAVKWKSEKTLSPPRRNNFPIERGSSHCLCGFGIFFRFCSGKSYSY